MRLVIPGIATGISMAEHFVQNVHFTAVALPVIVYLFLAFFLAYCVFRQLTLTTWLVCRYYPCHSAAGIDVGEAI